MARAKSWEQLKGFDIDYVKSQLNKKTLSELKAEYSRLRPVAEKRAHRLAGSEYYDSQAAKMHPAGSFKHLSEIRNKKELIEELISTSKYLKSPMSTLLGQRSSRDRTVETLQSRGFSFITKDNIGLFGKFMERMRAKLGDQLYDSERLVDIWNQIQAEGGDLAKIEQRFNDWLDVVETWQTDDFTRDGVLRRNADRRVYGKQSRKTSSKIQRQYNADVIKAKYRASLGISQHGIIAQPISYEEARSRRTTKRKR